MLKLLQVPPANGIATNQNVFLNLQALVDNINSSGLNLSADGTIIDATVPIRLIIPGVTAGVTAISAQVISGDDAGPLRISFTNSNTGANATTRLSLISDGTADDVYFQLLAGQVWCIGQDVSDSNKLKITNALDLNSNVRFSMTTAGALTLVNTLTISQSSSGGTVLETIANTSNTASSNAQLDINVAGTSAGDAFITTTITGGNVWAFGIDNSASDAFKISFASTLGTNDYLTINTTGAAIFAAEVTTGSTLTVSLTSNQIVLGNTNTMTINATAPSASRVITIPDPGTNASIVLTEVAQTLNGVKTFTSPVLIPDGSAAAPGLAFATAGNSDNGFYRIGTDQWAASAAGSKIWEVTSTWISQPTQTCFFVLQGTTGSNVTGDGTAYTLALDTEIFDPSSNFNSGTYTYTAPVTGKYLLTVKARVQQIDTSATPIRLEVITSNRTHAYTWEGVSPFTAMDLHYSVLADLDINDTVTFQVRVDGTTKTLDVAGNSTSPLTAASGSLIN